MRNHFYISWVMITMFLLVVISCSPLSSIISEEQVMHWEPDIERFDSLNAAEPADTSTLLVTGSSSVRLWNTVHEDLAPYNVMWRGYGGAKMTDFDYYADRIIQEGTMKGIIVFVANDITGGEGDRTPRELFKLYRALVDKVRDRNPQTPVFWIETTPTPSRWNAYSQVREANELIRKFCERNDDCYFIGTYDAYIDDTGLPDSTFFRDDMLHMNPKGYEIWTRRIKLNLEEAGITP
ncbi:MAG: GDSL-type esterase/lipase family protein [Bacteroidales bacterium]